MRLRQQVHAGPGSHVSLIIRPEHVRVSTSPDGRERLVLLPGRIVASILLGPTTRLQIALSGDLKITADLQRQSVEAIPQEGDEVMVSILRAAIVPNGGSRTE